MKRIFFINLIVGFVTIYCFGQNESIESKLMHCLYDNRPGYNEVLYNFEELLISENILVDKKGISYIILLDKIRDDSQFNFCPSKSLIEEELKLKEPNVDLIRACKSELLNKAKGQNLKVKEMMDAINNLLILNNLNPSSIATEILNVLSESDFEHYYYRQRVLFLLDIMCISQR